MTKIFIFSILTVFLVCLLMALHYLKKKSRLAIHDRFRKKKVLLIEYSANFFGQKSKGQLQARGNGALVLSDEELYFSLFLPRKEIIIPLERIKGVRTAKSFLGKSKFRPLLIVDFMTSEGHEDSIAWLIKDLSGYAEEIKKLIADKG